jgi:uncharacterized protein YjbI with pentapeptide repeats
MKKFFISSIFATLLLTGLQTQAKIWRVNNTPGVTADFTSFSAVMASASVLDGDTVHFESSITQYPGATLTKRLVIIGLGYYLNPANVTFPGNAGLQAVTQESGLGGFSIGTGANGSKFLGINLSSVNFSGSATPYNITFEKINFTGALNFANATHSNITIRKCFFYNTGIQATTGNLSNFVLENSIFYGFSAYMSLQSLTGSSNIIRNNTFYNTYLGEIPNCYFANNIIADPSYDWVFTNTTVKNNLFAKATQPLPVTASANQLGVTMTNVFLLTGSFDARYQLKAGSPAIAAGLTVGSVVTPDCGAFGATDPYKLSGIPGIPSIYAFTVPTSIPSGSATMNVTFSTRSNN